MIIDNESFTQIALHVRRASDSLLNAARELASFSDSAGSNSGDNTSSELNTAVESLVAMNEEFIILEQLLRAIWDANRDEKQLVS
ncbi:MAG: hypothetical protein ACE5E4_10550 [Candidatus Binatia bacterium]